MSFDVKNSLFSVGNLGIHGALVFAGASVANKFSANINPTNAGLLAVAMTVSCLVGQLFAQKITGNVRCDTWKAQTIILASHYLPLVIATSVGVVSIPQCIMIMGLRSLFNELTWSFAKNFSIFHLKFTKETSRY